MLAEALRKALPTYRVTGYVDQPDAVTRPTVMLWQSAMERLEQIDLDRVRVTLELWILTGRENPERADDDLDDALEAVLVALQPLSWVAWTQAERGIYAENYHGYRLTAFAVARIGD
jgi:predicted RNase H-like nuclease